MDLEILQKYKSEGWVMSHEHKTLPLVIWNYTQATQYEAFWDEVTMNCRGLVTTSDGKIVSKGFKKFFNYSENRTEIPTTISTIEVWEKMDGSYIGLFYFEGSWLINSKGSFYSTQAVWATEILEGLDFTQLNTELTYCFELIVPQNRIVCDYGDDSSLYFLSAFCAGEEVLRGRPTELLDTIIKFPDVSTLSLFEPAKLQALNLSNREGFVVKFENGERCKIKFEDYVCLHRIVTDISSYRVHEALRDKLDLNVWLSGVPDEFFLWVKATKDSILEEYSMLEYSINEEFKKVNEILGKCDNKTFALHIKNYKFKSFLFSLRGGHSIEKRLWDACKPKFKKPFKDEY